MLFKAALKLFGAVPRNRKISAFANRTFRGNWISGFAVMTQQNMPVLVITKAGIAVSAQKNISAVMADDFWSVAATVKHNQNLVVLCQFSPDCYEH